MSKVIELPRRRHARVEARERACAWLARLDAGATVEDRRELECWLAQHPMHRAALLEMASLWDRLGVLSELSEIFPLDQCAEVPRAQPVFGGNVLRGAAAVALLAMTFAAAPVAYWMLQEADPLTSVAEFSRTYRTAVGQQMTIDLPDGTEVILNTDTALEVDYSPSERNIVLQRGEGHFAVAADPQRPFRVRVDDRVVEAVGTAFSVHRTEDDTIEVVVSSGSVHVLRALEPSGLVTPQRAETERDEQQLARSTDPLALQAGEYATLDAADVVVEHARLQPQDIEIRLAWRHGMLLFQDETLDSVARAVSRYTTTRIAVDGSVGEIRVSGYFRTGDVPALLAAMRENFHIDAVWLSEDRILLTAR